MSLPPDPDPDQFARDWIDDWNGHDLDRILAHYADGVVFTSPIVSRIMGVEDGTVRGKAALRDYFAKGLAAFPDLHFQLMALTTGVASLSMVLFNQAGRMVVQTLELDADRKVVRVVVSYGDTIPTGPGVI